MRDRDFGYWIQGLSFRPRFRAGRRCAFLLFGAALAGGCAGQATDAPLRSPTLDYPPEPPREPDGRPMGADNIPPGERLEQGAKVGTENELAPGWETTEEETLRFDPKKRRGGATEQEGQPPEVQK